MRAPGVIVAGTHSGTGKTSVSLGLVAAWRRRGLRVQTFKVGPDFLDPTHLARASGRPCYNLDTWMCGAEYVRRLYAERTAAADVALIEGVMGLYDGAAAEHSEGSTAEIARLLGVPVLLVVNAHGASRSVAAMVKGFVGFEPGIPFAGVLANLAGSSRHAEWISAALSSASLPPLLGTLSRGALPELPSRHLGLVTATPTTLPDGTLAALADALERNVDLERLLNSARAEERSTASAGGMGALSPAWERADVSEANAGRGGAHAASPSRGERGSGLLRGGAQSSSPLGTGTPPPTGRGVRLGLAWDEAFHFYYADTLAALENAGCELVRFSPLREAQLPEGLDGLYFGGGYPEVYAEQLAANERVRAEVRAFCALGRPVYAECGGLMYLSQGIEARDGRRHAGVGALPAWVRMGERRKALGYVEVTLRRDALWGCAGTVARGHEFHYSELLSIPPESDGWQSVYQPAQRRRGSSATDGAAVGTASVGVPEALAERSECPASGTRRDGPNFGEGLQRQRTLVSYVHLHLASRPEAIRAWVAACRENG